MERKEKKRKTKDKDKKKKFPFHAGFHDVFHQGDE